MNEQEFKDKWKPKMRPVDRGSRWADTADSMFWVLAYPIPSDELCNDFLSTGIRQGCSYDRAFRYLTIGHFVVRVGQVFMCQSEKKLTVDEILHKCSHMNSTLLDSVRKGEFQQYESDTGI